MKVSVMAFSIVKYVYFYLNHVLDIHIKIIALLFYVI